MKDIQYCLINWSIYYDDEYKYMQKITFIMAIKDVANMTSLQNKCEINQLTKNKN